MTTEIRYMNTEKWTVNDLNTFKLKDDDSTTTYGVLMNRSSTLERGYWGIRVWKRNKNGNETEITNGVPVAQVTRDSIGEGMQNTTWTCPGTLLKETDAIVVRVYVKVGEGEWRQLTPTYKPNFITEQLNVTILNKNIWTVYYYTEILQIFYYDYYFHWGAVRKSRIEDFKYGEVIETKRPPLTIKKLTRKYGDNIKIFPRTETIDSNQRVIYTYPDTINTKALIYSTRGYREEWMEEGYKKNIDYVIPIIPDVATISVKDFISLSDNTMLEVEEVIPRRKGFKLYYYEVLCKKVK